jgi:hypothetical protein
MEAGADVLGLREHLQHGLDVGLVVVADHLGGSPPSARQRPAEERFGGLSVALLPEEDIDHLAMLVHRPKLPCVNPRP